MMQISNLMTYPVVREAVQNGSLELHGWVYDIPTGKLRALNQQVGVFEPIPHTHGELLEIA
jgi:carbonic anhydrase